MGPKKVKGVRRNNGYGSENDYGDEAASDDGYFSNSNGYDSDGEPKQKRITVYIRQTRYGIIKEAFKDFMEYHLSRKEESDWDILWSDGPLNDNYLKGMLFHQRMNHFPGMYHLSRKNMLGRHLTRMKNVFKEEYDFFPTSYCLPHDYKTFIEDNRGHQGQIVYISKPTDQAQGRGIFLTRKEEDIKPTDNVVV